MILRALGLPNPVTTSRPAPPAPAAAVPASDRFTASPRLILQEAGRLGLLAAGASLSAPLGQALTQAAKDDLASLLRDIDAAGLGFAHHPNPNSRSLSGTGSRTPQQVGEIILYSRGGFGHRCLNVSTKPPPPGPSATARWPCAWRGWRPWPSCRRWRRWPCSTTRPRSPTRSWEDFSCAWSRAAALDEAARLRFLDAFLLSGDMDRAKRAALESPTVGFDPSVVVADAEVVIDGVRVPRRG